MWLWDTQLRELGFKRPSERYWHCERRYDLPGWAHLSIYSWSEQAIPQKGKKRFRYLVEVTEFHVTFLTARDNLHFYYHERQPGEWEPGGHTSCAELLRLDEDPVALRTRADRIAAALVTAWQGALLARTSEILESG
jgi:hypothetical protein